MSSWPTHHWGHALRATREVGGRLHIMVHAGFLTIELKLLLRACAAASLAFAAVAGAGFALLSTNLGHAAHMSARSSCRAACC